MTFVPRKMLREESRTLKTGHNKSCGFTNETTAFLIYAVHFNVCFKYCYYIPLNGTEFITLRGNAPSSSKTTLPADRPLPS